MMNITDKNDYKHCSDKINNKKIKALEIDCTDEMNDYQKHYFVINIVAAVDSAALIIV